MTGRVREVRPVVPAVPPSLPGSFEYRYRPGGGIELVALNGGDPDHLVDVPSLASPGIAATGEHHQALRRVAHRVEVSRLRSDLDAGSLRIVR